jgi:hydroxymethylglutaryl-CoA lyase
MKYPVSIEITEVGPRDGLQNQGSIIATDKKVAFVDALSKTGLQRIEVSSFVNPKWVPQLADASEVFSHIHREKNVKYTALIPNMQGWDRALEVGVDEIGLMTAASETFCERNINTSISGSIEQIQPLVEVAHANSVLARAYVSCVVACPYEGRIDPQHVRRVVEQLLDVGVDDISLGDTIGVAVPTDLDKIYDALSGVLSPEDSILHLHDTQETAIECALAAMELGVHRFDTSSGGLGGCPYAPGAAGNLATEDLVFLANQKGIHTGVDLDALIVAVQELEGSLDSPPKSRVYKSSSCQDPSSREK